MSRQNVDKPALTDDEISRRIAQFHGRAGLWITHSSRFFEKAADFPGATFVVGADTAARLVDVRYYEGDVARVAAALRSRNASAAFLSPLGLGRGRLCRLTIFRYQVVGARSSRPFPQRAFGWILAHPTYANARLRLEREATNSRSPREACANFAPPRATSPASAAVDARQLRVRRTRAHGPLVR